MTPPERAEYEQALATLREQLGQDKFQQAWKYWPVHDHGPSHSYSHWMSRMPNPSINSGQRLPTGTVTFLFTDIEGSTKLAQQFPAELPALLARHHAILHEAIEAHNGYVFQIIGDAFCAAFHTAGDALRPRRSKHSAACSTKRGSRPRSKCAWACTPARRKRSN